MPAKSGVARHLQSIIPAIGVLLCHQGKKLLNLTHPGILPSSLHVSALMMRWVRRAACVHLVVIRLVLLACRVNWTGLKGKMNNICQMKRGRGVLHGKISASRI